MCVDACRKYIQRDLRTRVWNNKRNGQSMAGLPVAILAQADADSTVLGLGVKRQPLA